MICPSCGHDNFEGMDRCENCMKPLLDLDVPRAGATGGLVRSVMEDNLSRLEQEGTLTVSPEAAALQVAGWMKDGQPGCALVLDADGQLAGIFREHGVLCELTGAEAGSECAPVSTLLGRN